jgi:tetratricopeptide (TPR) repeat protein
MSPVRRLLAQALWAAAVACALAVLAAPAHGAPAKKRARVAPAAVEPAAQPAADPVMAAWNRARSLADQKRYDDGLEAIRAQLQAMPGNTDLLWLEAGITGEAGRNRDAVALYEKLMLDHPELARDLRRDLATQRLWAGDAAGAVRDLDLRLQEDPSDGEARKMRALALSHADRLAESLAAYDELRRESPGDVDLQLERARVLAWMGRNGRAAAAYREILRRHPDEARAKVGLAQNENWSGNHRRAAAIYAGMLKEGAEDPEITKGLAYAYYWDGRPEQSRAVLDGYLAQHPQDREGLQLARTLSHESSPSLTTGYERSDDSDALRVRTTTMEYRHPLRRQLTAVARWRRDNVKDQEGNRDPLQIGAGLEKTWSDRWSGQLFLSRLAPARDEDADVLGEANLTHRPADRVRIDAGFAKDQVLTRLSLADRIALRILTAGVDWQATDKASVSVAERLRFYGDGNRATLTSAAARQWVITERRMRLGLTFRVEQLRTDQDLDHGYYDPERYTEFGPGAELELKPDERWTFGFAGQIGQQQEKGSDQEPYHNFTATAEIPLGDALGVSLVGGRSNSNLSSASGFKQNRWAAYLTTRF